MGEIAKWSRFVLRKYNTNVYNIKELTNSHALDENQEVECKALPENIAPLIGSISKVLFIRKNNNYNLSTSWLSVCIP